MSNSEEKQLSQATLAKVFALLSLQSTPRGLHRRGTATSLSQPSPAAAPRVSPASLLQERSFDLTSDSLENPRSTDAVVTGSVSKTLYR